MNVLLTPYARVERNPEPLLAGLHSYNSNDGFGRADQLNFAAPSEDEAEYAGGAYLKKGKVTRQDPMSHRIIEKRRRDRMNNCLADLSRLIPPEYLKKGRGRVEKTEIIEMAIRHLKYLDGRANAAERQTGEEHFRAGYQEAVGEAVRFLVEVRGYSPADGLCVQMTSHMQRHVEAVTKGEALPQTLRSHPNSSSETNSSSSSQGYVQKGVITQVPAPAPQPYEEPYPMECDRGGFALHSRLSMSQMQLADDSQDSGLPIDGRRNPEPKLRAVRKPEHTDDFLHSYKFKNSIERRFSRSQDSEITEAKDMTRPPHVQNKVYTHKRRRAVKPAPSTSTSNSGSTEETRDTSPQDTSSESPHHHYDKPTTQYVPIFALNAQGKHYVPLSIDYACLSRYLGPCDLLDRRAMHHAPLHPVTIHVNFQSCMNYHVKRERTEEWQNH